MTIASGCFLVNSRKASGWHDCSKEQPAFISGIITVLSGLKILATSAMKTTPQKTITSASVAWAFFDNSRESPIKSAIS